MDYPYKTKESWDAATDVFSMLAYSGLSNELLGEVALTLAQYCTAAIAGNSEVTTKTKRKATRLRSICPPPSHTVSTAQLRRAVEQRKPLRQQLAELATECSKAIAENDTGEADHGAMAIQHMATQLSSPKDHGESAAYAAKHAALALRSQDRSALKMVRSMVSWKAVAEAQCLDEEVEDCLREEREDKMTIALIHNVQTLTGLITDQDLAGPEVQAALKDLVPVMKELMKEVL